MNKTTDEVKLQMESFREAAKPLIKWLCENCNPHVTAIITPTSTELLSGEMFIPEIDDYVKD